MEYKAIRGQRAKKKREGRHGCDQLEGGRIGFGGFSNK